MEPRIEPSNKELRKAIFALAMPIVWSNLLQRGVGIVDAIMVGHLGQNELAGVGMAQLVVGLLLALPMGIGLGTMIMVANATGAKEPERRLKAAGTGIAMSVVAALGLSVVSYFLSYYSAKAIGATAEVAILSRDYLQITAMFFMAKALINAISSIFQGAGDSKTPLSVIIWVNIVHIAVSYPLIYGLKIPLLDLTILPWGVKGAAFASGITELGGAAVLFWKGSRMGLISLNQCHIKKPDFKKIVSLGTPVFIERILMSTGQMAYARIVVGFSVAAYAAHQIGLNIESISWLPALGFAQATTAMVGQNIGAKQHKSARRVGYQSNWVAMIFMTSLGASYLLFPTLWVRLFTTDPEVTKFGIIYCYITAFVQPPQGSAMVFAGALRGAGNTRFVLWSTILGTWCVRLPFAYLAGVYFGGGIIWIWLAMPADWIARTIALLWRYQKEKSFHS